MRWPFRSRAEPKNETILDASAVGDPLLAALLSGGDIDKKQALSIPAVAAAVEQISNTIAVIPFQLYQEGPGEDGKKKVTLVDDKRVRLFNDDTGDTLDGFQFKKQFVQDYLLGKGGYAYINRRLNAPVSLHYVDESRVSIQTNNEPIFKRYEININGQMYEPYDFLKIIRSTKDGASGESLISEVNSAMKTAVNMLKYQLRLVSSGGSKRGFIKAQNRLDELSIKALREAIEKLNNNESNIVILNNGLDFQECTNTALEMQLAQTKNALNAEISAIFGISDDFERYFKFAIQPIVRAIETALNRDFLLETEKNGEKRLYWAADMSEITRIDMKSRFEAYEIAIRSQWITKNEVRYLENYEALDGLDNIDVGLGSVLLDTKTGTYYVPNTGEQVKMGEVEKKDEGGEE